MHPLCELLAQLWRNHPILVRDNIEGRLLLPCNCRDFGAELIWSADLSLGRCQPGRADSRIPTEDDSS
jgi:hypothetical protein